jgi:hypothetical protein
MRKMMERRITIDTSKYEGLTNDGNWTGTCADDSVIYHDKKNDWFATIALVQRDSAHFGSEDNPDMRLMADAPLILEAYKELKETLQTIYLWMYLDANEYTNKPNLYSDILDCIMVKTGEPDDLSGEIGSLINEHLSWGI